MFRTLRVLYCTVLYCYGRVGVQHSEGVVSKSSSKLKLIIISKCFTIDRSRVPVRTFYPSSTSVVQARVRRIFDNRAFNSSFQFWNTLTKPFPHRRVLSRLLLSCCKLHVVFCSNDVVQINNQLELV